MEHREESGLPPVDGDFMSDLLADLMTDWDGPAELAAASAPTGGVSASPERTLAALGDAMAAEPPVPAPAPQPEAAARVAPPAPSWAEFDEPPVPGVLAAISPRPEIAASEPALRFAFSPAAVDRYHAEPPEEVQPEPEAPGQPPAAAALRAMPELELYAFEALAPVPEARVESPSPAPPALSWDEFDEPEVRRLEALAPQEPVETIPAIPIPPARAGDAEPEFGPAATGATAPEPLPEPRIEVPSASFWLDFDEPPAPGPATHAAPAIEIPENGPTAVAAPAVESGDGAIEELLAGMDAELAARQEPEIARTAAAVRTERLILFSVRGVGYALPVANVVETERVPPTTSVPGTPEFVRGVANLRGDIIPVLDLGGVLGTGMVEHGTRLLVVRGRDATVTVGFVVDRVSGAAALPVGEIRRPPAILDERSTRALRGLARHEGLLINVLDAEKLFSASGANPLAG